MLVVEVGEMIIFPALLQTLLDLHTTIKQMVVSIVLNNNNNEMARLPTTTISARMTKGPIEARRSRTTEIMGTKNDLGKSSTHREIQSRP
jgi:hypothetical protein